MARSQVPAHMGSSGLDSPGPIAVGDRLRPVPVPVGLDTRAAAAELADPVPSPTPSMRGLEATIAIASLAAALLLGLLR